jgi:hypothetical protein
MVKAYTQEHVYRHPWERVTATNWRKFMDPENRSTLSHIVEVDTGESEIILDPSSVVGKTVQHSSLVTSTQIALLNEEINNESCWKLDDNTCAMSEGSGN